MTTIDPARLMRDIELYAGACMEVQKLEAMGDQECAERQRVFVNRRHDAIEATVHALAANSQGARP